MDEETTAREKRGKDCPSDAELAAYAAGGTAVGTELFEHLGRCAGCRAFAARRVVGAPLDAGDLIAGRYRIEHLLATGGIGAVVRALDVKLDRHVAIKLMLPHAAKDAKHRKRFEQEARLAVKMRSEHVARVLDVGEVAGKTGYIVLEYLVGEDLTSVLAKRGPLPVDEACEHVLQACEAMAEAHSLGIIHRDLKPANLFLTKRPDGSSCIKVIDFGIAKTATFGRDDGVAEPNPGLTLDRFVGTPRYMSPEQIRSSRDVDVRTDVWGMGVILYELLTGVCPFDGDSVSDLFAKILHTTPTPPSVLRPELPRALDGVIARCLARKPERRYGSVAELAHKLAPFAPAHARVSAERAERMLAGEPMPPDVEGDTIPSNPGEPPTTRRGPAKRAVAVAVGACAAAAIPMAWYAIASHGSTPPSPIGTACTRDDDCGGRSCVDRMCTVACTRPADCPAPSHCTSDGRCNLPLRVGFVYVGVPEDEGWTHTHDVGRKFAAAKLPYVETDYISNAYRPADAAHAVDDLVGRGFEVIIANSSSLGATMVDKAKQYPNVKFISVMSHSPGPHVGAINAREYEGWYLAGYAAAQRSRTHRLGYVGAAFTSEVVRDINAFTRGARAQDPSAVVELQWLGFWFDAGKPDADGRYKEERLTRQLLASGCDVIANHADNERVVVAVEQAHADAVSIANNNVDACARGPTTCLGVAYWNWGPLYAELLDGIHHQTWSSDVVQWESLRANPEASVVGFKLNQPVAGSKIALETAMVVAELAKPNGQAKIFEGPYCSTGQRAECVRDREQLSDEELRTMCWFVDGVIERIDPADPHSPERPASVPSACVK